MAKKTAHGEQGRTTLKNKLIFEQILAISASLILIVLGLLIYQEAYRSKIVPGVRVLGMKMGGKTATSAQKILEEYTQKELQKPIIVLVHGRPQIILPSDVEMQIETKLAIDEALSIGKKGNFAKQILEPIITWLPSYNLTPSLKFNEEKLENKLNEIASLVLIPAQDATLKYENGEFVVVPSKSGTTVDKEILKNQIVQSLKNRQSKVAILPLKGKRPEISESATGEAQEIAKRMIAKPITLTFEKKSFEASSDEIASWIVFKPSEKLLAVDLDSDKINQYLDSVAKKTDQKPINKEVVENTGQVLNEGKPGRALDREKAIQDISQIVVKEDRQVSLSVKEVQPSEKKIKLAGGAELGKFESLYVDINLSSQTLSLINGENVIAAYKVSTGKWSTPTPIGTRSVTNKDPYAYSSKYGLYMPFWMGIGGGYGIHELPEWPGGAKEGESHLGTPVSHGCIRLGVGAAETVYNTVGTGTPVNIHK